MAEGLIRRRELERKTMAGVTVLHVAPNLAQGGAERLLHLQATAARPGVEHRLALMENVAFFSTAGLNVTSLGFDLSSRAGSILRLAPAMKALRDLVVETRPSVVQGWLYYGAFLTLALKGYDIPIVWAIHNSTFPKFSSNPALYVVDRVLALASRSTPSRIIYCAESARCFHEGRGYSPRAGAVIENGVDSQRFQPDPIRGIEVRAKLGLDPSTLVVGLFGRNDPQKDIPGSLEAFAAFAHNRDDVRLLLAGRGMVEANRELHGLLEARNLSSKALLLGSVEDMEGLIAAVDVVMLGSRYGEALPMVLLEALASGKPIVATKVGDVVNLPVPSYALVAPGDPGALAGALAAVAAQAQAPRWSSAFAAVRDTYGLERCLDRYTKLYAHLAAGRPT
uniref:Glycosyltransferase n=1 Tax=Bosea sp. NBC_00436 TaxID=2969620 RepID=A0A9E7ZN23_9HYPH